jgi:transposase
MEGKSGKNDATDAAAVCEAASRPSMRFVPVKTPEQQGIMSLHRIREGYKEERTACINRIRGVLAEFGLVFGKSPKALRAELADVLEDACNELSGTARMVLQDAFEHWRELDDRLLWCDHQIGRHVRSSADARRAARITGAWLGLVPSQNSSGGKTSLGRITKRGDDYLRTLLIQGAKAAVMSAHKRDDATSRWLVQLKDRIGWQKACVAMANKNARILWAVMTRDEPFDLKHVSVKPTCKVPLVERPAASAPPTAAPCAA